MKNAPIALTSAALAFATASFLVSCSSSNNETQTPTETRSDEVLTDPAATAKPVATAKPAPTKPTATKPVAKPVVATASAKTVAKPVVAAQPAQPAKPTIVSSKTAAANLRPSAPAAKHSDDKLIRFVSADSLNVHASPRLDSPIVAKVRKGSMFTVTISGDWAKVSDGQYVLAKFLVRGKTPAGFKVAMGH